MPNAPGDIKTITLAGLLEQEALARSHGSGSSHSLLGMGPQRLWGKGRTESQANELLQWLNARLSISGPKKSAGRSQHCQLNQPGATEAELQRARLATRQTAFAVFSL